MSEFISDGIQCGSCDGTKERMINKIRMSCPECQGAGRFTYSPEFYAEHIGVTHADWQRYWVARIDWARRALYQWESDAAEALKARV